MATERIEHAKKLRQTIEKLAQNLNNNDSLENIELFPVWKLNKVYRTGLKIRYLDKLYRVTQDHLSMEQLRPDTSLGAEYFIQLFYIEPSDPQPWQKNNLYMMGDLIIYKDKTYKSLINNNVWSPADYPIAWEEVTE